jgi:hypothetical protein
VSGRKNKRGSSALLSGGAKSVAVPNSPNRIGRCDANMDLQGLPVKRKAATKSGTVRATHDRPGWCALPGSGAGWASSTQAKRARRERGRNAEGPRAGGVPRHALGPRRPPQGRHRQTCPPSSSQRGALRAEPPGVARTPARKDGAAGTAPKPPWSWQTRAGRSESARPPVFRLDCDRRPLVPDAPEGGPSVRFPEECRRGLVSSGGAVPKGRRHRARPRPAAAGPPARHRLRRLVRPASGSTNNPNRSIPPGPPASPVATRPGAAPRHRDPTSSSRRASPCPGRGRRVIFHRGLGGASSKKRRLPTASEDTGPGGPRARVDGTLLARRRPTFGPRAFPEAACSRRPACRAPRAGTAGGRAGERRVRAPRVPGAVNCGAKGGLPTFDVLQDGGVLKYGRGRRRSVRFGGPAPRGFRWGGTGRSGSWRVRLRS